MVNSFNANHFFIILNRYFPARRWSKSPCFYMYRISTSVSNNLVILKNKEKTNIQIN